MDAHAHAHGADYDGGFAPKPPLRAVHVPHVLPLSVYLKTWGSLLALTAVTVGASYVDFGHANLWIAILIASIKALLVASIFMHLKYDQKFHGVIFGMALVFLVIFIGFTMFDTETRGRADAARADRPVDVRAPFAGSRSEERMREKFAPEAAAEKPQAH